MAGEQEHAAGTGGQSGCGHLLHCFFTEVQEEQQRDTHRSSLHFRILFDLPHHQLHAGSGVLAGVVSFHIVLDDAFEVVGHQRAQGPLVGQPQAVGEHDGCVHHGAVDQL